jgi:hypothetical protein
MPDIHGASRGSLRVACRRCHAQIDQPCRTINGRVALTPHVARVDDYVHSFEKQDDTWQVPPVATVRREHDLIYVHLDDWLEMDIDVLRDALDNLKEQGFMRISVDSIRVSKGPKVDTPFQVMACRKHPKPSGQ